MAKCMAVPAGGIALLTSLIFITKQITKQTSLHNTRLVVLTQFFNTIHSNARRLSYDALKI